MGASYSTHIPGPPYSCNNSAYFQNFPPLAICLNENLGFDHSAVDPDGDSLVYSFETPFHGASQTNPQPGPPPTFTQNTTAPPFTNVVYTTGYSTNYPIASNPAFTLNDSTGWLSGTPNQIGQYVVTINAKEYRDGILINENRRDFQFNCVSCIANTVAIIQDASPDPVNPYTLCAGLTVDFVNQSILASSYFWNFGDPTTLGDTSMQFNPTYTFPDTGVYMVSLIANPGWPCADTTTKPFGVYEPIPVDFTTISPQCITNNSFDFQLLSQHTNGAAYNWSIDNQSFTEMEPMGISFASPGYYVVNLTVEEKSCVSSHQDTIAVYPEPELAFLDDPVEGCAPLTVQFTNTSSGWGPIDYHWQFSDGGQSNAESPIHTFQNPGLYSVNVQMITAEGCIDTLYTEIPQMVQVNPTPEAQFIADPLVTNLYNPLIHFTDSSTGADFVYYDFGDGNNSSDRDVTHTYWNEGIYTVMMIAGNGFGCQDTTFINVEVQPEYIVFIPTAFSPNGDGKNEFWLPSIKGVVEYRLSIFDRWGQLMFQTEDRDQGWDGTHAGKDAAGGTYTYFIELRNYLNERDTKQGTFVLIR
jgi:gliding motility-associated-like protein